MINDIKKLAPEFVELRKCIHAHPELGLQEEKTAKLVAEKLKEFGIQVHENIGVTGVVGVLKKGSGAKSIALRADMDALVIHEASGVEYASKIDGIMHACGHDGHTASLLLAAKYLSEQEFSGTINFIFQPAEEGRGGAQAMLKDNLFKRFPSDFVFGYHNLPSKTNKLFCLRRGAMMAGADALRVSISGVGGHGSAPEKASDVMGAMAHFITQASTITARNIAARNSAVITFGAALSGNETSFNILQDKATLLANIRTFSKEDRETIIAQLEAIAKSCELLFKCKIALEFTQIGAATINDDDAQKLAYEVACELFGEQNCDDTHEPLMGSEDFSFFLEECKGAYAFIQNKNEYYLHDPRFIYDDDTLVAAAAYYSGVCLKHLR